MAVKRVYFDAYGPFSIVPQDDSVLGLCNFPVWDEEPIAELDQTKTLVSKDCGNEMRISEMEGKSRRNRDWTPERALFKIGRMRYLTIIYF